MLCGVLHVPLYVVLSPWRNPVNTRLMGVREFNVMQECVTSTARQVKTRFFMLRYLKYSFIQMALRTLAK